MKSPLFLRNLLLQAVGDSSVGILFTSDNKQSRSAKKVRKYFPLLLLLGSAGMVYPLLKAEEVKNWPVAQASLISILVLLAAALCFWWQAQDRIADFSVAAATYHRALEKLLWCVAVGILAMIAVATQSKHWKYGIVSRAIGYGILIAGFCFIFGVLLGYLFGLRPTDNSEKLTGQSSLPHPNTNLAEIADWLTKIILGAGLVQLTNMPRPIWAFAQKMALGAVQGDKVGQPWEAPNPAVALAIMGFFSSCGLLYGYLWTRYEDAVTAYGAGDASAAALVSRWLNSPTTPDDPTCSNMVDAVKNTSSTARIRIFLQAEDYRKSATEDANERSLPVLQALVDADSEGVFHRNRSQYALALMGRKKDPKTSSSDWSQALSLLSDAIRIRDCSGEPAWREYEFARAVCQIKLDLNSNKGLASDAQVAPSIHGDLDQAPDTEVPKATKDLIDKDKVVSAWVKLNPKQAP